MLDTYVLASLLDHSYFGPQRYVTVDENTVGIGGLLTLAGDGHYEDSDKDEATKCRAIALETGTGTKLVAYGPGWMRDDSWAWTNGSDLFVGENGAITQTPPGAGEYSQIIGYAETATIIRFNPSPEMLYLAP